MANRSRGRRADYFWLAMTGEIESLDIATATAGLGDTQINYVESQTLMRLRGQYAVQLDATAVNERALVAFGIIKVKTAAAAGGVATIPTPFTEPSADWIWYDYLWVSSGAEAAVVDDMLFARGQIDSKAMRRVKPDESIIFVAEIAETNDQGGTVDIMYGVRALTAL